MPYGFYFDLRSYWTWRSAQTYEKMVSFEYFRPLWSASSRFWAGSGADHTVLHKNNESIFIVAFPMDFLFCFVIKLGRGSAQTYGKCSILSIFSRLGPFPQVFEQVKEWLILELCEMIKVPHIVAFPTVFLFWKIEYLRIAQSYVKQSF